jgi:site-specific DNA-methyltransferase (adenine-specific)
MTDDLTIIFGDAREKLRELLDESVQCVVTSPPYFNLRDYKIDGQIGLEKTVVEYIQQLKIVFLEVYRVTRPNGALWLNLGDSRNKQCTEWIGLPHEVRKSLQEIGWLFADEIVWFKNNPMPESVTKRTTRAHEFIFLMTKQKDYFYDNEAIKEPGVWDLDGTGTAKRAERASSAHKAMPTEMKNGIRPRKPFGSTLQGGNCGRHFLGDNIPESERRPDKQRGHSRKHAGFNERWDAMKKKEQCSGMRNKRSVWEVATHPYPGSHFAIFPPALIRPCIMAGSREGDTILDPFAGSGTTGMVALQLKRKAILIELNPDYINLIKQRCDIQKVLI